MPSNNTGYRAAKPTLVFGGSSSENNRAITQQLLRLVVSENAQGLYACEATLNNWDPQQKPGGFLYFDRRTLEFGKTFQVKLEDANIFEGRIMALEAQFPAGAPPSLSVLAEDRLQDLRMTRRTRAFDNISDADLFRQLAREHSLTADVSIHGPTHRVLAQVNQSDLALMRERARAMGVEVWVEDSRLIAKPRPDRSASALEMDYKGSLREFTVLADLSQQCTSAVVSGWDVADKSAIQSEGTAQSLGNELGSLQSGAAILQNALGARKAAIAHTTPFSSQEARAEAESYFQLAARRFVMGRGVCEADARLRVGRRVTLKKLGALFDGVYTLTEVKHIYDGRGIRTEFVVERPGLGQP